MFLHRVLACYGIGEQPNVVLRSIIRSVLGRHNALQIDLYGSVSAKRQKFHLAAPLRRRQQQVRACKRRRCAAWLQPRAAIPRVHQWHGDKVKAALQRTLQAVPALL